MPKQSSARFPIQAFACESAFVVNLPHLAPRVSERAGLLLHHLIPMRGKGRREDALLCARMLRSCMMKVNSAAGDSEGRALGI